MTSELDNNYSENLLVHFRRVEELRAESTHLHSIELNKRQLCDLEMLLNRAYYPLKGYMGKDDYQGVLESMRLGDGTLWPMPVCLDISAKLAKSLEGGDRLALRDGEGFLLAVMSIEQLWKPDFILEAELLYGSSDPQAHPGVRAFLDGVNPWYASGRIEGLTMPLHYDFRELRLTPSDAHRRFALMGWRRVIAYHSDRPMYRTDQQSALNAAHEAGAHLFVHPAVAPFAPGDISHYTLVRSYSLIQRHFPQNSSVLGILPLHSRMAGPREALLQAMIRKNFGCSHFMVADDQADPLAGSQGPDRFYPRDAALDLLGEHASETGIEPVRMQRVVYVGDSAEYLPEEKAKGKAVMEGLSSRELLRRLEFDLSVPSWFCHPEMLEELKLAYPPRHRQGFTIFLTGLPGSGKSTLAKVLVSHFMEMRSRPVTLIDGDIARRRLSSELGFSDEHRNLNIVRIGYVSSEITKNGGIAICASIAPFEASRRQAREMISAVGGFVEVHVATPLKTCEERDRKGMYAKARAGLIKGYTGVDSAYEVPSDPELSIDTTDLTPAQAVQEVLLYLSEAGYIK